MEAGVFRRFHTDFGGAIQNYRKELTQYVQDLKNIEYGTGKRKKITI